MKNLKNFPEILYEDKHILVVNKPSGLIVQGAKEEKVSLLKFLKDFIKERDKKPGNVFLGVVHRLDKSVSGALIIAKRSKAAKKLFEIFQKKEITKIYLALVEGYLKGEGTLKNYIIWNEKSKRAKIFKKPIKNAKESITKYKSIFSSSRGSLVLLYPLTGRKHQLRVTLSYLGHPIVGDIKYGAKSKILKGKAILLHSLFLNFPHPITKEPIQIFAPPPSYFPHIPALLKADFLKNLFLEINVLN